MESQTFFFRIKALPAQIKGQARTDWLSSVLDALNRQGESGFVGLVEGAVETEGRPELEKNSLDRGGSFEERMRDWVASESISPVSLYFSSQNEAERARAWFQGALEREGLGLVCAEVERLIPEDWNEKWQKSFEGCAVPPFWEIIPSWKESLQPLPYQIRIQPGSGFGTGTHETTQLCLTLLGELAAHFSRSRPHVLDFGTGSGILSVAACKLGAAHVDAVDIDELALENAKENLKLNECEKKVKLSLFLEQKSYACIIANILKPVLLENVVALISRLDSSRPHLILSGLLAPDVEPVRAAFENELRRSFQNISITEHALGEWRALLFKIF